MQIWYTYTIACVKVWKLAIKIKNNEEEVTKKLEKKNKLVSFIISEFIFSFLISLSLLIKERISNKILKER